MTPVMITTMVLCFALTVSVAVSIGLASILGIQVANANMLISFTEISMLALATWMPRMEARPMETATDTVSAKHSTMVVIMTGVIARSPAQGVEGLAGCRRCQWR